MGNVIAILTGDSVPYDGHGWHAPELVNFPARYLTVTLECSCDLSPEGRRKIRVWHRVPDQLNGQLGQYCFDTFFCVVDEELSSMSSPDVQVFRVRSVSGVRCVAPSVPSTIYAREEDFRYGERQKESSEKAAEPSISFLLHIRTNKWGRDTALMSEISSSLSLPKAVSLAPIGIRRSHFCRASWRRISERVSD